MAGVRWSSLRARSSSKYFSTSKASNLVRAVAGAGGASVISEGVKSRAVVLHAVVKSNQFYLRYQFSFSFSILTSAYLDFSSTAQTRYLECASLGKCSRRARHSWSEGGQVSDPPDPHRMQLNFRCSGRGRRHRKRQMDAHLLKLLSAPFGNRGSRLSQPSSRISGNICEDMSVEAAQRCLSTPFGNRQLYETLSY